MILDQPAYEEFVQCLTRDVSDLGDSLVSAVVSYFQTAEESFMSSDRRTTIMPLVMAGPFKEAEINVKSVHEIVDYANENNQFEVFVTGEATFSADWVEGNQKDAGRGEAIGGPIALIILAVVFGALVTAILPMLLAISSILLALAIVLIIGQGAIRLEPDRHDRSRRQNRLLPFHRFAVPRGTGPWTGKNGRNPCDQRYRR